ncbi:MAG: hypothetical protein ACOZNI_18895 [Myxococcota bacterium]
MRFRPAGTLLLVMAASLRPAPAAALDLALAGSWSTVVDASDLTAGPGSALQTTHESGANEVIADVTLSAGASDAWRVDVRRLDVSWPAGARVWVRRTGAGSGSGSISGGSTWLEVTSVDTPLFAGAGDRTSVPLQVRVTGVSLSMPPDSYVSSLLYTVVDTP